jgi:hypothetical protein
MFRSTSSVRARITPFTSLSILDFTDNHGKRIEGCTGLVVFDGREGDPERDQMDPVGRDNSPGCELEIYLLYPARSYEIRHRSGRLLNTITFSAHVTITAQCL